jgi:hypothetical protein
VENSGFQREWITRTNQNPPARSLAGDKFLVVPMEDRNTFASSFQKNLLKDYHFDYQNREYKDYNLYGTQFISGKN